MQRREIGAPPGDEAPGDFTQDQQLKSSPPATQNVPVRIRRHADAMEYYHTRQWMCQTPPLAYSRYAYYASKNIPCSNTRLAPGLETCARNNSCEKGDNDLARL